MQDKPTTTVLVTGAAGYVGSHTVVALLERGYGVVALDNHCNGSPVAYERVQKLTGASFVKVVADVRDEVALAHILSTYPVDACIHLAALKAVAESGQKPLDYWSNNVGGLLAVLRALQHAGPCRLVFSSSATVYGVPEFSPVPEAAALRPASVYGQTKLAGEQILLALAAQSPLSRLATLRYFNPVGAHPSGLIGEAPHGTPNNLMPYITQVALRQRHELSVFGGDYPTPDGTCIRDYIHIQDLAAGHVAALRHLLDEPGSFTVNLGTGRGTSVRELISTFDRVNGVCVPSVVVGRRSGDVSEYFADPSLAKELLGWCARHTVEDMCRDAWRWQLRNPEGYT
ncbi:UDP-glucose 4-epimerase GalE [Polaromonas sp.]|uniref:UDP-glucose 4-epimerase GalE n=1 Tax=Polaromonas sp. TaxID=1869339 RepID=UPI00183C4B09|nr:UDP-glucose 4-epimerase GalE [Polaromonas sp.]NML86822.1 UDP-glucose 4-epimerase GalE [Polaromonas sp.]